MLDALPDDVVRRVAQLCRVYSLHDDQEAYWDLYRMMRVVRHDRLESAWGRARRIKR